MKRIIVAYHVWKTNEPYFTLQGHRIKSETEIAIGNRARASRPSSLIERQLTDQKEIRHERKPISAMDNNDAIKNVFEFLPDL